MTNNLLNKKIIVVHPGQQHSYHLATALKNNGLLYKYITTVYNKKGSFTNNVLRFLKGNNKKRGEARHSDNIPDNDILLFCEIRGLLSLLILRVSFLKKFWPRWNDYLNDSFGKKVAKYAIKNNVDIVISYDNNSSELFGLLKLKAPNITCVLDCSAANRLYVRLLYENEMKKNKQEELCLENPELFNGRVLERIKREIKLADYFLVPSQFVKKSLEISGINSESILVAPYGVDINHFRGIGSSNSNYEMKIVFLYVGRITYAKGLNYLLDSFSKINNTEIELRLVGNYSITPGLYEKYKDHPKITFLGNVMHNEMKKIYSQADVLIIPSLNEGMSLSGLEGWSCGLPLICTMNSGVNDFVENYKNGIVIPAGDSNALTKAILWFINNQDKLKEMKDYARKAAENLSWETYNNNIYKEIKRIL
ncbi:glycosyltransferase family 4 protein [Neobacillus sp. 19]|uniref:glycosyltransferase family 4 protein n=1 Tax=Neobacillus sp. 19 TaxID=3394458 RepID=UPI003BF69C45